MEDPSTHICEAEKCPWGEAKGPNIAMDYFFGKATRLNAFFMGFFVELIVV